MDRRRFIVTGIAAGAVSAALATDACSPRGGSGGLFPAGSAGDVLGQAAGRYVLNVQVATTTIKGYKLRGRTYNGKTTGPTIVTRPGSTLSVEIVNKLPPNPAAAPPRGHVLVPVIHNDMEAMDPAYRPALRPSADVSEMNNPHDFNTTNLHVHGIQTVPHLFDPIGTSDPSAMMIRIEPGRRFQYHFPIPKDHPSGLHWYHPHSHGSTDVQVSNGMAGLIIMRGPIDEVPEIKAAREIFMTIQTLDVNPGKHGVYEREYIAYRTPANGGYNFNTLFTMITNNGEGIYWTDNTTREYTPLGVPQFQVQPGEVIRLRLLNGTGYMPLLMALPGFGAWLLAFDGVNVLEAASIDMSGKGTKVVTPANLFSAPIMLAHAGNRIELLLRAPAKKGTYTLSSLASNGVQFRTFPKLDLAQFVVAGSPVTMGIPTTLPTPTREYPVITEKDIVNRRTFVFAQGPNTALLTGFGFTVNNELYDMSATPTAPRVGTCEEWRVENAGDEVHPFHLHENSFQLIAINDKPVNPMEIWDTFSVPPKANGKNGSITIRIRFLQWYGKTVFHCHILPHEDTGMMQNILMA